MAISKQAKAWDMHPVSRVEQIGTDGGAKWTRWFWQDLHLHLKEVLLKLQNRKGAQCPLAAYC